MGKVGKSLNDFIGVLSFRLGPATRQRLNIPVHIEVLDPTTNQCFGNPFSRFEHSFECIKLIFTGMHRDSYVAGLSLKTFLDMMMF